MHFRRIMIKYIKKPIPKHYYKIGNMIAFKEKYEFIKGEYSGIFLYNPRIKMLDAGGPTGELILNGKYYPRAWVSDNCLVEEVTREEWLKARE